MRIVLDTNGLVSALLHPQRKPARVLEKILKGEVTILIDERILREYDEVLHLPKFDFPRHGITEVLEYFLLEGERVLPESLKVDLPDLDDLPFLEVAVSAAAEALVTGNKRHFPADRRHGVRVTSPAEFLDWLQRTPHHPPG